MEKENKLCSSAYVLLKGVIGLRESRVEKYLVESVKKSGGKCPKFSSPGNRGVPDRIVLLPGRAVWFVEVKGSGGKLSRLQEKWIEILRGMGFEADVVNSFEGVDELMEKIDGHS